MKKLLSSVLVVTLVFTCQESSHEHDAECLPSTSIYKEPLGMFDPEIDYALSQIIPLIVYLPDSLNSCRQCEVLSIVAPEVIRYNLFSDLAETSMLEVLYAMQGSTAADFSIGLFQMKPSFIEKLESSARGTPLFLTITYENDDAITLRRARLQRMMRPDWQMRYAYWFWLLCSTRIYQRTFSIPQERVSFFASAYNLGFDKSESLIEQWQYCKYFPYGKFYTGRQYAYAELSKIFYHRCLQKTKPTTVCQD